MDAASVLARFDAEIRADPPAEQGVERVWADGVLRTLGAYNFIGWWDFPAEHRDYGCPRKAWVPACAGKSGLGLVVGVRTHHVTLGTRPWSLTS